MAKKSKKSSDGYKIPWSSAELDGDILTAAKSTMTAESFAHGYDEVPGRLKMRPGAAVKRP